MESREKRGGLGFSAVRHRAPFAAGAVLVALAGCGSPSPPAAKSAAGPPTLSVATVTVRPEVWPEIARSQGSLVADEIAVVGAKVAGRVADVHVDLGDSVRAGRPLVTLDRTEFALQVAHAKAQLEQAKAAVGMRPDGDLATLDPLKAPPVTEARAVWDEARAYYARARELQRTSTITQSALDQAASAEQVAAARYGSAVNSVNEKIALIGVRAAELALAQRHWEDAVVVAPFDGLIQQRQVAPGGFVQVGDPVSTIVRANPLRFRGMLPERRARQLAVGQQVRLRIESVDEPRTAVVTRISPSLNELSRALMFEARIDNADGALRTGLFAEAEVVLDPQATAIVVPATAVVEFAGAEKVWKVKDGLAGEQVVRTGARRDDRIEILAGLSQGDVVLVDGRQGQVARIRPLATPTDALPATPSATSADPLPTERPPETANRPHDPAEATVPAADESE